MRHRSILPVVAVVFSIIGAGCTTSGSPTPTANTPTTSTSSKSTGTSSNDNGSVPKVKTPLDAASFLTKPCSLLTQEQMTTLGLEPGKEGAGAGDIYCSWFKNLTDHTVGFLPKNKNGLADTYRANDDGRWAYWEPTTVDGYPAVFEDAIDTREKGDCNIVVGIRDELTFRVDIGAGDGKTSCARAKEVASAVIATLKGA